MKQATTYSSRIQLPTETPPQLMPPAKLLAMLSRRAFFRPELSIEIGCAPLYTAGAPPLADSRRPSPRPMPLGLPLPMFMAGVDRTSLPLVDWRADVRFDIGG